MLDLMHLLGLLAKELKKFTMAENLLGKALNGRSKVLGDEHQDTGESR